MRRGLINGIPVWIKLVELTSMERTVLKEAPGVDGAVVEPQGQQPQRYRCEFALINDGQWIVDDYETATLDLQVTFLAGGPFTVTLPVQGELTNLWMAEPLSLKFFDDQRLMLSEGSVTFVEGRPFPLLQESAAANIETAISALTEAAGLDFANRVPDTGSTEGALAVLDAMSTWLSDTQALINAAFEPVNNFSGAIASIASATESLLSAPGDFASLVMGTAAGLLSLVPSLSRQGDPLRGSAAIQDDGSDKPAVVFREALESGTDFDSDVPPAQGDIIDEPSEEDLEELDDANSARSLTMVAVTNSVCFAIVETKFATVNSILGVAESLEPAFEKLFALDGLDHRVYAEARRLRASARQFLSEQAAGLPRLRNFTATHDTDLLDILPDLYESLEGEEQVQAAIDSVEALNSIHDPLSIIRGTTLRYLDTI